MYSPDVLIFFVLYFGVAILAIGLIGWAILTIVDRVTDNRWMQQQGREDRSWGLEPIELEKRHWQKHYNKGYYS